MEKEISSRRLAALLKINIAILWKWNRTGILVVDVRRCNTAFYRHSTVNDFLERHCVNFSTPATLQQIIDHSLTLTRPYAAAAELSAEKPQIMRMWIGRMIRRNRLRYIDVNGLRLIDMDSIIALGDKLSTAVLTCDDITHIMGMSLMSINRAQKSGRIVFGREEYSKRRRTISHEYIIELLRPLMQGGVTAEIWFENRMASDDPLISILETCDILGLSKYKTYQLIASGEIHAIRSIGGRDYYVSLESVRAYLERKLLTTPPMLAIIEGNKPLAINHAVRIFGVSKTAWGEWQALGLIVCPLHPNDANHQMLWNCFEAIIQPLCSPNTSAKLWMYKRLMSEDELTWSERYAANFLGSACVRATNTLPFIVLPSSSSRKMMRRFEPADVRRLKKKLP